jgi:oligopeptide transport system ATP-binding protein
MASLLQVKGLETQFFTQDGVVKAVNGISYELNEGETLGIVGESGSGKSVGVMSIMRLIPSPPGKIVGGEVLFEGRDLLKLSDEEVRNIRGNKIAMIFQDPMTSLNPVIPIGKQISEAIQLHLGMDKTQAMERTVELLEMVGIPSARDRVGNYPHQFSGGMRQRVMIAIAMACRPKIVIADEPTTALDVTVQAQIVELVKRLQEQIGVAVIWITHDLGVVAGIADRVLVMYGGTVVENAPVDDLYEDPRHPYTIGLLKAIPRLDATGEAETEELESIEGVPPDLFQELACCPFAPRGTYVQERCWAELPLLANVGPKHQAACFVDVKNETRVP